jgi:hypothetical protein
MPEATLLHASGSLMTLRGVPLARLRSADAARERKAFIADHKVARPLV